MILIADSGSTSTDWAISSDGKTNRFKSGGINPSIMDEATIHKILTTELSDKIMLPITEVWFYGAGCLNGEPFDRMTKVLSGVFVNAQINVRSDLVGAAKSVLKNSVGIVAILGTGSNSGLYNGKDIVRNVPPLGYILGDEGSGTWFGKRLLADYLRGIMPLELRQQFKEKYSELVNAAIQKIYKDPQPNKTLASTVPFLVQNRSNIYCANLLHEGFSSFIHRNITLYEGWQNYEIAFVGSVAYVFKKELKAVLEIHKLKLGEVIKEPLQGLLTYHLEKNTE